MSSIINHRTTQVNLTIIPNKPVELQTVETGKLRAKLSDVFETASPFVTQFPDLLLIFEPNNQINITVLKDNNRIIIGDNKLSPYMGRSLESFLKLAKGAVDIINQNDTQSYGFNILSVLEVGNEGSNSGEMVKEKFVKTEKLEGLPGGIESAGLTIIYQVGDARHQLKIEPRFSGSNLEPTKLLSVNLNAHFAGQALPELTALLERCTGTYDGLARDITRMIE